MIPVIFEALLLKYGEGKIVQELSLMIGCLFLAATLWVYLKFRNGSYSNFDVSVQKQRKSLYLFVIPLLIITSLILYITNQPTFIFQAFVVGSLLMITSFILNFFLKTSLHVSLNTYLAASVFIIDSPIGIGLFLFTLLIAWSRIHLKRHTIQEVLSGFITGLIYGSCLYWITFNVDVISQSKI